MPGVVISEPFNDELTGVKFCGGPAGLKYHAGSSMPPNQNSIPRSLPLQMMTAHTKPGSRTRLTSLSACARVRILSLQLTSATAAARFAHSAILPVNSRGRSDGIPKLKHLSMIPTGLLPDSSTMNTGVRGNWCDDFAH
jgi:hypothetical protein